MFLIAVVLKTFPIFWFKRFAGRRTLNGGAKERGIPEKSRIYKYKYPHTQKCILMIHRYLAEQETTEIIDDMRNWK
jgi:hypothetical protein